MLRRTCTIFYFEKTFIGHVCLHLLRWLLHVNSDQGASLSLNCLLMDFISIITGVE